MYGLIPMSCRRSVLALPFLCAIAAAADLVDFNRDVRPILSDRCFGCHGPDANKGRKAGLRLDEFAGATKQLKSGDTAIVPGDLKRSAVIARLNNTDPDEVMPPPELHRPLSAAEKDILTRWIAQGAKYDPHWAFVSPKQHPAPPVKATDWPKDPLDRFILAKAEAAGLRPSAPAERATWLRRVSLVLTGLPPTPAEVDSFLADQSPDAFEKKVDALLASPRYGEHLAVAWMDLARYADTWGYTGDNRMFAWPWRDWVLRAFNENLPYDRFLTEQLAGDLLPDATQDQRVATAFNRLHRMTFEGGSIAEEFRQDGINDRVMTAGYAFMGLTVECARCHDHKYDPISQRDFYSLAAMFGDQNENGLLPYHGEVPPPFVRLFKSDEERAKERRLRDAVTAAERALSAVPPTEATISTVTVPTPVVHLPLETFTKSGVDNAIAGGKPAKFERRGAPEDLQLVPGVQGQAIKFDGDAGLPADRALRPAHVLGLPPPRREERPRDGPALDGLLHRRRRRHRHRAARGPWQAALEHDPSVAQQRGLHRDGRRIAGRRLAPRHGYLRWFFAGRGPASLPRWSRGAHQGHPRHAARQAARQRPRVRHAFARCGFPQRLAGRDPGLAPGPDGRGGRDPPWARAHDLAGRPRP